MQVAILFCLTLSVQGWATGVHTLTGLPNGNALVPIGTPKTGRFPPDGVRAPPLLPGAPLVDPSTHAGAITVPMAVRDSTGELVPHASGDQCTVQPNVDYDHGTVWITTQAANPGDCCAQCSANGESRRHEFHWCFSISHPPSCSDRVLVRIILAGLLYVVL